MTTRICDKCQLSQKEDLYEVHEEYGNFELCKKCTDEANKVLMDVRNKFAEELSQARIKAFHEWIGKPLPLKRSWFQRVIESIYT